MVHAILCSIAEDMVNGAASISWCSVLADMLNAPVAKLTVSDDVDTVQDLSDARTLLRRRQLASPCMSTGRKWNECHEEYYK